MIHSSVGIRSIAVNFPSIIRTNDYWQQKYPEMVTQAEQKTLAKLFKANQSKSQSDDLWSQTVTPYLSDPFRGSIERRVLAKNETSRLLEGRAAKDALKAAELSTDEVDLAIVTTLFPEQISPGNATYLARELGLRCPAWNLESTCSSALVSLENACALVRSGKYRNILVIVSCIYSHFVDEEDTLSWFMGDGAGAFVVSALEPNQGFLGNKIIHTQTTCGSFFNELIIDERGQPRMRIRTGKEASQQLGGTALEYIRSCCAGAVASAGVSLDDIDFFAFNTPTAWYADLCTQALGINPERTINLYPQYANIGPVLPIANLYHGARAGKLSKNDLVLVYTVGSASTAAATVMRWGDVALGSIPASSASSTEKTESASLSIH